MMSVRIDKVRNADEDDNHGRGIDVSQHERANADHGGTDAI